MMFNWIYHIQTVVLLNITTATFCTNAKRLTVMNSWKTLFTVLVLVAFCFGQQKKDKKKKDMNRNPMRQITNWDDYRMPKEVKVEDLKNILEKVAEFRHVNYCPFGKNYEFCLNEKLQHVVSEILKNSIHKDDEDSKINDLNSPNILRTPMDEKFAVLFSDDLTAANVVVKKKNYTCECELRQKRLCICQVLPVKPTLKYYPYVWAP